MKHILNVLLILVAIINPLGTYQGGTTVPVQAKAQAAPVAVSSSRLEAAYPPPVTTTPQPTATPRLPTATKSPTPVPVTPTPTPTAVPTEESPATGPQIRLEKSALTYEPGKPIQFKWKIENSKSGAVSSRWQIRTTLPTKWTPTDAADGTFDAQKRQLKVIPSSLSNNVSLSSALDSGDEDILIEMYDGEKYLSGTVLHLRAKTSVTIQTSGGEISG